MVTTEHHCDHCPAFFYDKTEAEEHEKLPVITLPKGFIFFQYSSREPGWVRGVKGDVNLERDLQCGNTHDAEYVDNIVFSNLYSADESPNIEIFGEFPSNASTVRMNLEVNNRYRYATDGDIRQVLSHERLVSVLLDRGLTELTLDLDGKRTVPIVYSGEPILT